MWLNKKRRQVSNQKYRFSRKFSAIRLIIIIISKFRRNLTTKTRENNKNKL